MSVTVIKFLKKVQLGKATKALAEYVSKLAGKSGTNSFKSLSRFRGDLIAPTFYRPAFAHWCLW